MKIKEFFEGTEEYLQSVSLADVKELGKARLARRAESVLLLAGDEAFALPKGSSQLSDAELVDNLSNNFTIRRSDGTGSCVGTILFNSDIEL